jgi:hypothetical protein
MLYAGTSLFLQQRAESFERSVCGLAKMMKGREDDRRIRIKSRWSEIVTLLDGRTVRFGQATLHVVVVPFRRRKRGGSEWKRNTHMNRGRNLSWT